jgi:hypothetical protein
MRNSWRAERARAAKVAAAEAAKLPEFIDDDPSKLDTEPSAASAETEQGRKSKRP